MAGKPILSDVSVIEMSEFPNPVRLTCVAVTTGIEYSTARPRISSAIALTIVYELTADDALYLDDAQIFK